MKTPKRHFEINWPLQQEKENQNVTKNYASVWKKKVDRQKSIRSLELEKLKNIQRNQDPTENSIEIQSPETAAEQRTDEANIVTNPVEWPHLNSWASLSLEVNTQGQRSMKTAIKNVP